MHRPDRRWAACAAKPLAEEIAATAQEFHPWPVANRGALTGDGKVKFHKLATGAIRWRASPNKVAIRGVKDAVARRHAAGRTRFPRDKLEIDKQATPKGREAAAAIERGQDRGRGRRLRDRSEPYRTG